MHGVTPLVTPKGDIYFFFLRKDPRALYRGLILQSALELSKNVFGHIGSINCLRILI